jgi:predicted metal-dependent phosphoesterase TrpH
MRRKREDRVRRVDLHLHSNRSDGEYAPGEVVRRAAGADVCVLALTDHDTTAGLAEARAAADGTEGLVFLPGIEITTEHPAEQHILGYDIDCASEGLRAFTERLIALRRARADNILAYLKKRGVGLSYAQTEALTRSDYIGRPQIAAAMAAAGYVGSIREAFGRYLSGPVFRKVPRPKPAAEEAIAAIRAAGGAAVLAHPDSLRLDDEALAAHLGRLKAMGLAGLECHYGEYGAAQTQRCLAIAGRLGLIATGGSDFHGPHVKPGVEIGTGRNGMLDFRDPEVAERLKAAGGEG